MPKLTRNPASIVESSPVCLEYEDIAAAKESFLPSSEGEAISERTRQEEWMEVHEFAYHHPSTAACDHSHSYRHAVLGSLRARRTTSRLSTAASTHLTVRASRQHASLHPAHLFNKHIPFRQFPPAKSRSSLRTSPAFPKTMRHEKHSHSSSVSFPTLDSRSDAASRSSTISSWPVNPVKSELKCDLHCFSALH